MKYHPKKYLTLKSRLKNRYKKKLITTIQEMKLLPKSAISTWVYNNSDKFTHYSDLNWYFLNQLQVFNFFNKQDKNLGKNQFGEQEEIVFDKWNQSEFTDYFLKSLNAGNSLGQASVRTLKILDKHLVVLGERHILNKNKLSTHYRIQGSLGEFLKEKKISKSLETIVTSDFKKIKLMTSTLKEKRARTSGLYSMGESRVRRFT
jgi:hypothetical protein